MQNLSAAGHARRVCRMGRVYPVLGSVGGVFSKCDFRFFRDDSCGNFGNRLMLRVGEREWYNVRREGAVEDPPRGV